MTAYYNEIDPFAAQWLRNLIAAGHIAPGDVDERSIEDVRPDDLKGYTQCHFFAGIGVWSLALRSAGWEDSRPIWTGSCPCQPFSVTGQKSGFTDERHLWPAFYWLIRQCGPGVVAGEQVASKAAEPWLDLVQSDMEAMGYAFGAVAFPSAGVGAPHIRDRTYWGGYADQQGLEGQSGHGRAAGGQGQSRPVAEAGVSLRVADTDSAKPEQFTGERAVSNKTPGSGARCELDGCGQLPTARPAGPTNGFWRAADWLGCRDGKWRPVEPGTFPLAHGAHARVGRVQPTLARLYGRNRTGRLKGYGNAINADAASAFAATVRSILDEQHDAT